MITTSNFWLEFIRYPRIGNSSVIYVDVRDICSGMNVVSIIRTNSITSYSEILSLFRWGKKFRFFLRRPIVVRYVPSQFRKKNIKPEENNRLSNVYLKYGSNESVGHFFFSLKQPNKPYIRWFDPNWVEAYL